MIKSEGTPPIALLGCGCSPATEPVAEISHYAGIIHVRTEILQAHVAWGIGV